MDTATDPAQGARRRMIARQLEDRGIRDPRVLDAFRATSREAFLPERLRREAHADRPLPIGHGQTISQPYVVALALEWLALLPGNRVLDVGCGSGYVTALLDAMGMRAVGVERHTDLARRARKALRTVGARSRVIAADATELELPPRYDAVHVAAAAPAVPSNLLAGLAPGGKLVMPVGPEDGDQRLERWTRGPDGVERESGPGVRFVPLVCGVRS